MLRKKICLMLIAYAVMMSLLFTGAQADDFEFTVVSGTVTDAGGNGVAGVRVQLHDIAQNTALQGVFTDANGHWESTQLDVIVGYSYLISYYKAGCTFNVSSQSFVAESGGTTMTTVRVTSTAGGLSSVASDYTYTPDNVKMQATITGYTGTATAIRIPDSIDGYTVTGIGNSAFTGKTTLKKVWLSENVTTIGNSVFKNDTALTEIHLPNGLKSIGSWAFENCTSLTEVVLPDSLTSIGGGRSRGAQT